MIELLWSSKVLPVLHTPMTIPTAETFGIHDKLQISHAVLTRCISVKRSSSTPRRRPSSERCSSSRPAGGKTMMPGTVGW